MRERQMETGSGARRSRSRTPRLRHVATNCPDAAAHRRPRSGHRTPSSEPLLCWKGVPERRLNPIDGSARPSAVSTGCYPSSTTESNQEAFWTPPVPPAGAAAPAPHCGRWARSPVTTTDRRRPANISPDLGSTIGAGVRPVAEGGRGCRVCGRGHCVEQSALVKVGSSDILVRPTLRPQPAQARKPDASGPTAAGCASVLAETVGPPL
jgi:hypothetical protein